MANFSIYDTFFAPREAKAGIIPEAQAKDLSTPPLEATPTLSSLLKILKGAGSFWGQISLANPITEHYQNIAKDGRAILPSDNLNNDWHPESFISNLPLYDALVQGYYHDLQSAEKAKQNFMEKRRLDRLRDIYYKLGK